MTPVQELQSYLTGWGNIARSKQLYGELLGVEVGQEIAEEVAADHNHRLGLAYSAEQHVLEAQKRLTEAQCPSSPGGVNITPCEAKTAFPLLAAAAQKCHDGAESVVVK